MSWKSKPPSLRARLLALLLPTAAAIVGVELWLTRQDALEAANAAYDRSLLGAIKSLDLNVSTASGGLSVELPYRLFEFFQLTASGQVYFRVATSDGLVEIGHPDLPAPLQPLRPGVPQFYDAQYFGEALRVGAYQRALEQPLGPGSARALVIQVAESTQSREHFTRNFVWRAAARDALVLAALAVALALLVTLALKPVMRLAREMRSRPAHALEPLGSRELPSDIEPLVAAVNQQLQRSAELMHQQRSFLDDASHQLRTSLATLRTQLDVALREPEAEQRAATLKALSMQLDRATRVANQLLALARSDTAPLRSERFELGGLLRAVALELLPQAQARRLDFGLDEPPEGSEAFGDAQLLREALANLVHNAIRHTPPGGEVTLQAARDALGSSLVVLDSGPGLPPGLAARLGERFLRGRGSAGAGLGLAIARAAIERHGGVLQLEPRQPGPGMRAALWWPHADSGKGRA